jgi:hypothetical protein
MALIGLTSADELNFQRYGVYFIFKIAKRLYLSATNTSQHYGNCQKGIDQFK